MTQVNTKTAQRRALSFKSMNDLGAELDRIEAAHRAGTLRTTGNWSAGQILQHVGKFMRYPIDGFPPGKPPWLLRVLVQMIFKRRATQGAPPPAGIRLKGRVDYLLPDDSVSFDAGMALLREQMARIARGERFKHPSPLFGDLTHEDWTRMQLGHASLHLGFFQLG